MGRKKQKVQPFDFSDYQFDSNKAVDALYPTDADKLARLKFLQSAKVDLQHEYYTRDMIQRLERGDKFADMGRWAQRNLLGTLWKYETTAQATEVARFRQWYDGREDTQQVWKECFGGVYGLHSWTEYYNNGTYSAKETKDEWAKLEAAGPVDPCMWENFLNIYSVKDYVELHRNPKYEIGDLVLLRKGYVGNYRYDPDHEKDNSIPRFGTVMGYKEKTGGARRSASGKGSRTVSVMWMGKSDIVDVMEKTIKLESRKGHKMGKV